jgi:prepilin-type processing-associated H-X9-DG protein
MLPYVEQEPLYARIDFTVSSTHTNNAFALGYQVPMFVCPSDDNGQNVTGGVATNSYPVNYGSKIQFLAGPDIANGVFPVGNKGLMLTFIKDGTSNTAAFCERLRGDLNNGVATVETDVINMGTSALNEDDALAQCQAADFTNLAYQWRSDAGTAWIRGRSLTVLYSHVSPPNAKRCGFPANTTQTFPANSNHNHGVNLLLCDGSVRWVSEKISVGTWRAVGSRNGKDILGSDW